MKKGIKYPTTQLSVTIDKEGESIEEMLRRMRSSKEPIQANAKIAYTERKDGVLPWCDIRTDRFEQAMMAADRIHASKAAERQAALDAATTAAKETAAAATEGKTVPEA